MVNEKNVLLISMSILSNKEKNYYYVLHSDKKPDCYTGISSMAAGTKHVLHRLARQGRNLDKVIVLTTPEVKGEQALEQYMEEIKSFINEGDDISGMKEAAWDEEVKDNVLQQLEEVKTFGACCTADDFEKIICQIDIPSPNAELSYSAIPEIVREISKLRANDNRVNLFLDMQGGSRVSTFIVNSAVNMMRDGDNVKLERSYATLYNRKYQVHQLRDESMSNHVLDLVSGMDEFLNYGKAKKFLEYYDYYMRKHYRLREEDDNYPEKKVIESIKRISDAIGIANVDGFYQGLNALKVALDDYKEHEEKRDDLFVGFIDRIEKAYEGILDSNRRAIDVMDWCIKKEWYQQALTVCESKMPELFIRDKVVYYCKEDGSDRSEQIEALKEYFNSDDNTYKKNNADVNLFVIKYYEYKHISPNNPAENPKSIRPFSLYDLLRDRKLHSKYWRYATRNKTKGVLEKYFKICKLRNSVNHGDSQSVNMTGMLQLMREFIAEYRELVGDNWKDPNMQFDFSTLEITYDDIKTTE